MLRNTCIFVLLFAYVVSDSSTYNAPFLKRCKLNDNECLLSSNLQIAMPYIAEGIQEIGISSTDPMILENIIMDTDESVFKFVLPTLKVQGGRKCKVTDFMQNLQESTMKLTLDCPFIGTGTYKFSGKMSVFNIEREGDFKIHTDSLRTIMTIKMEKTTVNGKKYWNLLSYEYTCEPSESMHIEIDGLFSGELNKARSYLSAVNKDWDSTLQVGKPIADAIVKNTFKTLKSFFLRVPIEDLLA
ncbi:Circadian clock-controlled protein [Papilio machaon]|uniref:Circadian clock-controlled protein n=1 Tax=Papilio machaon TaxID=76193 RepID=A0A194RFL6_PAPMA|nr:Circadian clock-controlled protein [Papilio machaon]